MSSPPAALRMALPVAPPAPQSTPPAHPAEPDDHRHHHFHWHHLPTHTTRHQHPHREHIEIASAIIAAAVLIGLETLAAVSHADRTVQPNRRPAAEATSAIEAASITAASATTPAVRARVRVTVPSTKMPPELIATISAQVSAVSGCTHTLLGDTVVTAAHCHEPGFTVSGDIAWKGPQPSWTDATSIPMGATIYAIGYPQATPGAQSFSLSNLGLRTITVEHQPVTVLMTEGNGVACSYGASGMVGWVTIGDEMVPIGPMSVFAVDPAITGLPAGQYVCGFATT